MYFIYGMYWMLNIVTAEKENPQAILIRGIEGFNGPGKLTRRLQLDKSFYGEDICSSTRLWLEDCNKPISYITTSRIGIDYAGDPWKSMPWRFVVDK
jgi:DNA-3-methyladenine glycosylase